MYHLEFRPMRRAASLFNDREFDRFFQAKEETFMPPTEILSTEKSYLIRLDIPGVDQSDLEIEVKEDQLIVSGERKVKKVSETEEYFRSERKYGKFSRAFSLPKNLKTEFIEAHFENGVLEIVLPKVEKTEVTKIKISSRSKQDVETGYKS
jgi:HSP20 family protein